MICGDTFYYQVLQVLQLLYLWREGLDAVMGEIECSQSYGREQSNCVRIVSTVLHSIIGPYVVCS